MRGGKQAVAALLLSSTLMVPTGALATGSSQDDQDRQEEREQKVYDPLYKDYHSWDAHEEEAYRRWLDELRSAYAYYGQLSERTQKDYWKWRHKDLKREHHIEHAANARQ